MGGRLPTLRPMRTRQAEFQAQEAHRWAANTIEVINEALFFTVDSPLESGITTPGVAFHCSPHKGIREKYTAGNYGKVYPALRHWTLLGEVTCLSSY
ncbi:hypothetical protein COP2_005410 [Malus domestica]